MIFKFLKDRYTQIVIIVTLILLFSISLFVIEPKLKQFYLEQEMDKYFWVYYFVTFIIISISLIVFWYLKNTLKAIRIENVSGFIITVAVFSIFYQTFIKDVVLSLNLLTYNDSVEKTFTIEKFDKDKMFLWNYKLHEMLEDSILINKINSKRIAEGKISVFNIENKDSIDVEFKKGLFGIEYFK